MGYARNLMLGLSLMACEQSEQAPDAGEPLVLDGDAATVVGALMPDEDCVFNRESSLLVRGTYDVLDTDGCGVGFNVALLIENHLAQPPSAIEGINHDRSGDLQLSSAQVTLRGDDDLLIDTGALPNPFTVTSAATIPPSIDGEPGIGVALIEAIPRAYRASLAQLGARRATVIAYVEPTVEALNGMTVALDAYRFPIALCSGCLTVCASEFSSEAIEELTAGMCVDNAGADGRFCIDGSC